MRCCNANQFSNLLQRERRAFRGFFRQLIERMTRVELDLAQPNRAVKSCADDFARLYFAVLLLLPAASSALR